MSIKSTARSHSADPAQESLRQKKDDWNSECRVYIARLNSTKPHLIAFKRALNGIGDAKAGLPSSNIKDPLPAEASSYLNFVSSEFNELASMFSNIMAGANSIIREQAEYSAQRRKPNNASKNNDLDLIVEASNPITREWAHLSTLFFRDDKTGHRLSMLDATHNLFRALDNLQDIVLDNDINNIDEIISQFRKIENQIKSLNISSTKLFEQAKSNIGEIVQKNNISNQNALINDIPVDNKTKIEDLKSKINSMVDAGFNPSNVQGFLSLYDTMESESNQNKKQLMTDRLRSMYKEISLKFQASVKKSKNASDDYISLKKEAGDLNLLLEKYSANYLSKLYKEYTHKFRKPDAMSASRMELFQELKRAKKYVDNIMDLLESKSIKYENFKSNMENVQGAMTAMLKPLDLLALAYQNKHYDDMPNRNSNPVNRYFNRRIRRDIDNLGR